MVKQRKGILTLLISLMILCITCGVWSFMPKTAVAAGETITVTDDFANEKSSNCDYYEKSNNFYITKDVYADSSPWGALVATAWGDPPANAGGTAYLVYKLSPDLAYSLDEVNLTLNASISHEDGLYWWNSERQGGVNKLGANITVYVSDDNTSWNNVWNAYDDGGAMITKAANTGGLDSNGVDSNKDYEINLSSYVGNEDLYIKIEMYNMTIEEINHPDVKSLNLGRYGVLLFNVDISATQTSKKYEYTRFDDFTAAGSLSSFNFYDYDNVAKSSNGHKDYPLIPAATWEEPASNGGNGFFTYRLDTGLYENFDELIMTLDASIAHRGLGQSININKSNVRVFVSATNDNFTQVFGFGETYGNNLGQFHSGARRESVIDLTSYAKNHSVIYIKVQMLQMSIHQFYPNGVNNWVGNTENNTMGLAAFNTLIYGVKFDYNTIEADNSTNYVFEEDFSLVGFGDADCKTAVVDSNNVISDRRGHTEYGFVPAAVWSGTVSANTGYITYAIPLNGNGTFSNLADLKLAIKYYLANRHNADLIISAGFDGSDFSAYNYSIVNNDNRLKKFTGKQFIDLDLTSVVTSEAAKSAETLYVKITMVHDEVSVALGELGVRLHKVSFVAKQNFVMDEGAAVRISEDTLGLKFTSFLNKDLYDNAISTYGEDNVVVGMFILPKDYIETYGEISLDTIMNVYAPNQIIDGRVTIAFLQGAVVDSKVNGYYSISGSINNIKAENLTREFVGVAMLTINSGSVPTFAFSDYANCDINNTARSAAYVAQMAVANNAEYKDVVATAYLTEDVYAEETTYTVIHHIFNTSQNVVEVAKVVGTAKIGETVSVTPSTSFDGFTYVESVVINGVTYTSQTSGMVLANGRLELHLYYYTTSALAS